MSTAQQSGAEDREPTQADDLPSGRADQDATLLTEEELVEARFREEMIERRRAEMLQKRSDAAPPEADGSLRSPPPPPPPVGAQRGFARPIAQAHRQMQTAQDPQQKLHQEQTPPFSQSTPQESMQIQQKQMQTQPPPQHGPKELMRQRMLASKHRRQGVAALQSGEAAAALAALSEAQALTPDDSSLAPLVQRAQVMLGRHEAGVGAANAAHGRADEEDGSPRPAEPAPLPPRATAGAADALPEGWAEGSLEGTPFYYPVSDPSRIQWSPPLAVPPMPPTTPTPTTPTTPTTRPPYEEDGSPRPAEPAPLPPRATAGAADALPEGWAEGSLEGTPFYYPVSDPSRIQWSPPLAVPPMPPPPTAPTTTPPPTPTTTPTTPTTMRPSSHTGGTAPRSASRTTREDRQLQEEPSDVEEPPRVFYQVDGGGAVAFRRSPE